MFNVQLPSVEPTQGIFWYWTSYGGGARVAHNGSDYGVATDLYLDPATGLGIVVLANTDWRGDSTTALMAIEEELWTVGETL